MNVREILRFVFWALLLIIPFCSKNEKSETKVLCPCSNMNALSSRYLNDDDVLAPKNMLNDDTPFAQSMDDPDIHRLRLWVIGC